MIIITRLKDFYSTATNSIAFYPTLAAIISIVCGLLLGMAEENGASTYFQKTVPELVINDLDTARNLITTIIAGGISMLVFSFSMVMLLLSQAATNYSPRVLPNLISERRHQIVLGIFLSTILFNIVILLNIENSGKDYQAPGFSVLLGVLMAIVALGTFVYFIHSISSSIQINSILFNVFTLSRKRLQFLLDRDEPAIDHPDTDAWHEYYVPKSGTVQNISNENIKQFALRNKCRIYVVVLKGQYLYEDTPLLRCDKELTKDLLTELLKNFNYMEAELVSDNYILGFKQITEIALKAMSPGINDPGTAIDSINYLTDLIRLRQRKSDYDIILDDNRKILVSFQSLSFDNLLYMLFAALRPYCKHDFLVMLKLAETITVLKKSKAYDVKYYESINMQSKLLLEDARHSIKNASDLGRLEKILLN